MLSSQQPKNPKGPDNPKELEATTGTGTDVVSTVQDANRKQQSRADQYAAIADDTGGRFYDVNDPAQLPRIFVKESQLNARALIQEGRTWTPARVASTRWRPVDMLGFR